METEAAVSFLEKQGIKPSYPRLRIYLYLHERRNHPTVDMIFTDLSPEIPTLSKTTVYNTLNLFMGKSIVQTLTIEEHENRYDIDTSDHIHFKCESCGEITDIPREYTNIELSLPSGFLPRERQVYVYGTCPGCS